MLQASTDQSVVDTLLPFQMGSVAFSIIQLLGIIAVMSQIAWQVFIIFIPVIAISIWYQVIISFEFMFYRLQSNDLISNFVWKLSQSSENRFRV